MKWLLIGSLSFICSLTIAHGDAAADLYNQGAKALGDEKYADAAKYFDQIVTGYPNYPNIDDVRIHAGYAYFFAGQYPEAIDRLAKEAAPAAKPEFRATALYYTALAQFSQGQKITDKFQSSVAFGQAVTTLGTLIDLVSTAPTPDNQGYLETALYYRALAQYQRSDYDAAEKDLLRLTQSPQFAHSLSRPDYLLRLGSIYAVETNDAVKAKKPADVVTALENKALDAFDQVSRDPNALVQANEANMSKAEMLFLVAQLDSSPAGYAKALDAFRLVRRKQDMIEIQQQRLAAMKQAAQQQLQASPTALNNYSLVIGREEGRLTELQNGPDPIIQALIRMAECYVSMKEPDEARTILHRLVAHAQLTADQQQEVDFQMLYSYVLGGQIDQADKALTAYLAKHASDPQADSISFQMAAKLMDHKDWAGALAQADRSLKDFPQGTYVGDVISIKAAALARLGRNAESAQVVQNFLEQNPASPQANSLLLTRAQNETSTGDRAAALADYEKVKDNPKASPDMQAAGEAGYIQTLQALGRFDDVIAEAKAFETKYPKNPALSSILVLAALAMDQKHDPGAIAALQAVARDYPKGESSPFALFYIVNIYQRAHNVPAMIQAAADLRTAYPEAYPMLTQAADAVSAVLIVAKKFDDALALYKPLLNAPDPAVAATAHNKIGAIWLADAKSAGAYQSMSLPMRADAEKKLASAEQSYLDTLTQFPGQLAAVGDAFDGLITTLKQRHSWGLLKDADLEAALGKLTAGLTTPEMQARVELAKAGLVLLYKDGASQYPAALDRFKKAIADAPELRLTRQETDQYGELLLDEKDYATAEKIYSALLANAAPNDQAAQGDAYYGLGATALGQGNLADAKSYFMKLKALPGGGLWHPHIADANYGIALADEQSTDPAQIEEARQIYAQLMKSPQGGVTLQAKAMLGYGRLLDKAGHGLTPTAGGPIEFAVHYFQEPHLLFGPAVSELSAEGLYDAGQVYEKAGNKADAKKQYDTLLKTYATTAPDWAAKAQAASTKLGV